ncbi:MAG: bifunctional precorrin-2 dehydrogenase/sirohydrochlorin ferrochelatase [Elusimicrobia bacterium]|nr:bifunctional precorrin-2 dehydrogenase/sirohydrochlorin ferrochelatase [Elusimicrobiota bacterium]
MARSVPYPAFLSLVGKKTLVVGGGAIAARKARALARSGARVRVVAPRVCHEASRVAERVARRRFRPGDVAGAALVVCATSDETLNARVSELCRERGIWANVADRPALCDFILPAVLRRGRLSIAVSTGGASPFLARRLRLRLERFLTPRDVRLARTLHAIRPRLLALGVRRRRRALKRLAA